MKFEVLKNNKSLGFAEVQVMPHLNSEIKVNNKKYFVKNIVIKNNDSREKILEVS
jgi:hypothetical protein